MIIVPPLGLEDAFLESYSVVRNAKVQAMYHVKFPAVDRLDIAILHYMWVYTFIYTFI